MMGKVVFFVFSGIFFLRMKNNNTYFILGSTILSLSFPGFSGVMTQKKINSSENMPSGDASVYGLEFPSSCGEGGPCRAF